MSSAHVLAPALALLERPVRLVDVGCRWGFPEGWSDHAGVELIGFDPDTDECRRLTEAWTGAAHAHFVPQALGARPEERTLYVTKVDACSSLFPPVEGIWETVPQLDCVRVESQRRISVVDLDSWRAAEGVGAVDAMKLDVQGAELEVLQGATGTLRGVRAVALEVTFNEIYAGQPLFGEIDAFMGAQGFVCWRLDNLVHYSHTGDPEPIETSSSNFFDSVPTPVEGKSGQLFWAHALFVAKRVSHERDAQESLADACALSFLGAPDVADACFARAQRNGVQE